MDACAALVPCHSVDYNKRTKTCYYSNHHGAPTIMAAGFDSAQSMGCAGACGGGGGCGCGSGSNNKPDPEPEAPIITPTPKFCPQNHGKIIEKGGQEFRVSCEHSVSPTGGRRVNAGTEEECMAACAADPDCHGANFFGKDNSCMLHPPTQQGIQPQTVDGGVVALSPIDRVEPYCPRKKGQVITKNGIQFRVHCDEAATSSPPVPTQPGNKQEDCAEICANTPSCYAVNWQESAKMCNLHPKNHNAAAGTNFPGWIAYTALNKP